MQKEKENKYYRTPVTSIVALVGSIGSIIAVLSDFFPKTWEGKLGVIFIGLFSIIFLIDSIIYRIRHKRNLLKISELESQRKYSKIIPNLNAGFSRVHNIYRLSNNESINKNSENLISIYPKLNPKDILDVLGNICTNISDVFSELTNEDCGVCIKIVKKDFIVHTLCRDKKGHFVQRDYDQKKLEEDPRIENNSDFKAIYENMGIPNKEYFISNNLPARYDYKNSSFQIYGKPDPNWSAKKRAKEWKLPYKSAIVVPIAPGNIVNEKNLPLGYLCVDSDKIDVFHEEFDVNTLSGVANGIYNLLQVFTLIKK